MLLSLSNLDAEQPVTATFDLRGAAFRFGNVVGPRQTHGVGFDFVRRLLDDPTDRGPGLAYGSGTWRGKRPSDHRALRRLYQSRHARHRSRAAQTDYTLP